MAEKDRSMAEKDRSCTRLELREARRRRTKPGCEVSALRILASFFASNFRSSHPSLLRSSHKGRVVLLNHHIIEKDRRVSSTLMTSLRATTCVLVCHSQLVGYPSASWYST